MPTISALHQVYSTDPNAVSSVINGVYDRIEREGLSPVWISLVPRVNILARIEQLKLEVEKDRDKLPLYGLPFAVKDNIDARGLPTTAACPALAHDVASDSALVVLKLEQAGAILIGKTNMDQFATGLVGTRTPYGICTSVFNANHISGGSSSGSAVAVASGLVSVTLLRQIPFITLFQVTFALGTDTAGSGRVPAMFNNVVGLKPTRGIVSTRGVLPACRSLDCVSVFAETTLDASTVLTAIRGYDASDPYSRVPSTSSVGFPWSTSATFRLGVPTLSTREFFDDDHNPRLFQNAIDIIERNLGGQVVEFDLSPFLAVANLLYEGPWVAERYTAVGSFVEQHADDIDPIVRHIITKAKDFKATDAFCAAYELERLKKIVDQLWATFDVILVPTAPRSYTIDEVRAAPMECNTRLGYYTNFVNLLDLAAIAIPAGMRPDGLPFGVTLIGRTFTDMGLLVLGDRIHRALSTTLGDSKRLLVDEPKLLPAITCESQTEFFHIAVVGAHLSGQPLNYQLTERKAHLVRTCRTRIDYRLYVLKDCLPIKPGLLRVIGSSGPSIELEIWALPIDAAASFIDMIPSPLSIGSISLEDGSSVKGFLVESAAIGTAQDVTHMGGWRAYMSSIKPRT